MTSTSELNSFFYPSSVCVIGATENPSKLGSAITQNVLENTYQHYSPYFVSHTQTRVFDHPVYKSILDIPNPIELAIVLVPAKFVPNIVNDCIQKAVKAIIIVTAGFGEMGVEGKNIEADLATKCRSAGIRLIGPNCVGIENIPYGLNASFIQKPQMGGISMITQSGSFGAACIWEWEAQDLGAAKFINLGNAADVQFHEALDYLKDDPETKVIVVYLESVKNGRLFYEALRRCTPIKPVVLLKGGTTQKGMKAAQSHTGSIASNFQIFQAAVNQAGGILCDSMANFITAMKTFLYIPVPTGDRVAVITGSGGSGVLYSDFAEQFRVNMVSFSEKLCENLQHDLLSLVKLENPLDMIASADELTFYKVSKTLLESPEIDIVVPCSLVPPFGNQDPEGHMRGVLKAWEETNRQKSIVPLMVFSENFPGLKKLRKDNQFPLFFTPNESALATKFLLQRFQFLFRNK